MRFSPRRLPLWPFGLAAATYVLLLSAEVWLRRWASEPEIKPLMPHQTSALFLVCLGVFYAVGILIRAHPLCRPGYAYWLQTINWRAGLPLPRGPVRPTLVDAAVLLLLSSLALTHSWTMAGSVVLAACTAYCVVGGFLACITYRWWSCAVPAASLAIALAAGFAPQSVNLAVAVGAQLMLVALTVWLLSASLKRFPWQITTKPTPADLGARIGGPILLLTPRQVGQPSLIGPAVWMLPAVLFGSVLASAAQSDGATDRKIIGVFLVLAFAACAIRVIIYMGTTRSRPYGPYKAWRIKGTPLLSAYDQIYVAPVVALGCAILLGVGLNFLLGPSWAVGLAAWAVLTILLGAKPDYNAWLLCGGHNMHWTWSEATKGTPRNRWR